MVYHNITIASHHMCTRGTFYIHGRWGVVGKLPVAIICLPADIQPRVTNWDGLQWANSEHDCECGKVQRWLLIFFFHSFASWIQDSVTQFNWWYKLQVLTFVELTWTQYISENWIHPSQLSTLVDFFRLFGSIFAPTTCWDTIVALLLRFIYSCYQGTNAVIPFWCF